MKILFTHFSKTAKFTFIVLLFSFNLKSANAAFIISNSTSWTVNVANSLTVANLPTGTTSVQYFVNGGFFSTASTNPYSVAATATTATTFTEYAVAYNGGTNLGTTATVTVTVYPAVPAGTNGSFCVSGTATLTAAPGTNPSGGSYNWYAAASGGTALQSSASTTYTTPVLTTTTTYYATYVQNGLESQTRTAITANQNTQPVLATVPTSPASGLYLSYPFTGNANDVSGNANTGTLQSAPGLVADRFGNAGSAYSFNGSSQYISTTTSYAAPGPANFSISVWFKTTTGGGKLIGFGSSQTGSSGSYDRHIYLSTSGQIYFGLYPGTVKTISTTGTYIDGNWHHIVAVESTTAGASLYVDGAIQAADPTMTGSQNYNANGYWRIAYDNLSGWTNSPANYYYTGTLDDIAIFNTALTSSQVYATYGAGSPPTCIGSPLILQVNGVSGCTYAWTGPNSYTSASQNPTVSNSATTAMAGTYTCTVTNTTTGCSSVINVTAVVNPLPVSSFTLSATQVAPNGNVTITNTASNAASATYTWNFNGGTIVSGSGAGPYVVNWASGGLKTVTQTVTNISTCAITSSQTITVNSPNYSTYAYSIPMILKTTGLGMSTDQTNFPFLVTITDPSLIVTPNGCSNKVQFPNGPFYDFAFIDGTTATEDNYQVEKYDPVAGTLLVWVKIPTLSHTTNNSLTFYYGSPTAPSSTHTTAWTQATWASDYKAVYHFNEAAYTGSLIDATATGSTLTASNLTAANQVAGIINKAYSFNGSNQSMFNTSGVSITGNFTLSAWVNLTQLSTDQKIMTNQTSSGGGSGGYKVGVFSNNLPETESGAAGDRGSSPLPATITTSQWYYIQGVYNGSTITTYVNGVQYEVLSSTTNPLATSVFYVGVGEGGATYYWHGLIDEPRVSNVAKSTDWISAEYQNQRNPASLITYGALTTNITNAATINGGIVYTTTDGVNYTYTANSATTSATPPNNGTASFVVAGTASLPTAAAIYQLTVNASNMVDVNGQTLSVGCNIVNNGTITNNSATPSTVTFNGTSATQSYTGATGSVGNIGNLTINNTANGVITITGAGVNVATSVNLTKGSLVIDNAHSGALTLLSTATQTAGISAIPAGASITGTVNAQRYISGGSGYRGYRLMSSPVYAATVGGNNVYSLNYLINNVVLTGSSGPAGGFDKAGNPTLYLFREDLPPSNATFISGNFLGISQLNNTPSYNYYVNGGSTAYNLPMGTGYLFFFRGNRASASLAAETTVGYVPVTATLTATGTLTQGQVTVHNWYTPASANIAYTGSGVGTNFAVRGFNLVGNPYASSIDWETFNTTTSTTGIYGSNVGTVIYEFNELTKNYDTYQKGGVYTNNATRTIVSGQGFYVLAIAANPILIFNESAKVTTQNTGANLFLTTKRSLSSLNSNSTNNINFAPHMRLQLALDSVNTDDIYLGFGADFKTGYVENEDAGYRAGQGVVSISSVSTDNIALAINKMPFPGLKTDTIPIKVYASAYGQYKLNMTEFEAISPIYEVWLMDRFNKDSLDMRANKSYIFNLTSDTSSYGAKRFSLVIRQNSLLGVHLLNFTAVKATQGAQVSWKVENEQNYTGYSVQRSTDNGKTFVSIDTLTSTNIGSYTFVDTSPVNGVDLYRLQQTDLNGAITYSKIIPLSYGNGSNSLVKNFISIYPNPALTTLNVAITEGLAGSNTASQSFYGITIVNSTGQIVKTATVTQATWQADVSGLVPGTYVMQVIDNYNKAVIGKSTFIKL